MILGEIGHIFISSKTCDNLATVFDDLKLLDDVGWSIQQKLWWANTYEAFCYSGYLDEDNWVIL